MSDQDEALPTMSLVRPSPTAWEATCPCCGVSVEVQMMENDAGGWVPEGPDVAIRCDGCDTLFEVRSVVIL